MANWYDDLSFKEAMEICIKSHDMIDRIECDIDQVIGEEANEEFHRDNLSGVKFV